MPYRKGAIGALMDEYERAAKDLMAVFSTLQPAAYERIRDTQTRDESCRSIQTILSHVVSSGYSYADYLRASFQMTSTRPERERQLAFEEVPSSMNDMLEYTIETLQDHWEMPEEKYVSIRFQSSWGQPYDMEQILEHAIVHILRHRRQVEKFLGF